MSLPANPQAPDQEQTLDVPSIIGLILGATLIPTLMLGIMMPVLPWLIATLIGLLMFPCALLAQPPLRRWLFIGTCAGLFPGIIFLLVESLPMILRHIG